MRFWVIGVLGFWTRSDSPSETRSSSTYFFSAKFKFLGFLSFFLGPPFQSLLFHWLPAGSSANPSLTPNSNPKPHPSNNRSQLIKLHFHLISFFHSSYGTSYYYTFRSSIRSYTPLSPSSASQCCLLSHWSSLFNFPKLLHPLSLTSASSRWFDKQITKLFIKSSVSFWHDPLYSKIRELCSTI